MASVTPVTLSDGHVQLDPEPGEEDSITWSVHRVGGSPLLGRLTLRQESEAPNGGPWSRARLYVQVDAPVDSPLVATLSMAVLEAKLDDIRETSFSQFTSLFFGV